MATGTNAKALWGLELTAAGAANFGQGGTSINKPFGYAQDIAPKVERGMQRRYNLGSRAPAAYSRGMFSGSVPVSHDLTDPFILELLFGSYVKSGVAGAYTYTFSEEDVLPSAEIQVAETLAASKILFRQLFGCTVKNAGLNIDCKSADPLRLAMELAFANEERSNAIPAAFASAWAVSEAPPMGAFSAKWYAWSGSAYAEIAQTDSIDIKLDHGTELRPSVGSEFPTRQHFGMRKWDISTINLFDDAATYMDALYGNAPGATAAGPGVPKYIGGEADGAHGLKLVLTGQGDTPPTWTFEFSKVIVVSHSNPVKGPDDELMESVELMAGGCSLVVANWPDDEPTRYA